MKALYNLVVLLAVVMTAFVAQSEGLNRCAATGCTDICTGSDPEGSIFPHNLGSKIQIRSRFVEMGSEVVIPKFTYKKALGRTYRSKPVAHFLPGLEFAQPMGDDMVGGLKVVTHYGMGAKFPAIYYGMESETLLSGTYLKPYLAKRLTDRLSIGGSIFAVWAQELWDAPFDVGRVPLPIDTHTEADGWGFGWEAGLFYEATPKLSLGLSYMSAARCQLSGETKIYLGPFGIKDKIKTEFKFPDKLGLQVGYRPAEDWLIVADCAFTGYSSNSINPIISFQNLGINKGLKLKWQDSVRFDLGVSRRLSEHWTVGGGVGWASKAIPDATIDNLTPDVEGKCAGFRLKYSTEKAALTFAISKGWGSNKAGLREVSAEVWTLGINGTVRF